MCYKIIKKESSVWWLRQGMLCKNRG